VADVTLSISGGDKIAARLAQIGARLGRGGSLAVGFLEDARYPVSAHGGGLHVAQVAFWNEFGTIKAPPRPFFRRMIAAKSPGWGKVLAASAKRTDYDVEKTLGLTGEVLAGQLRESITQFTTPALAPSTVARKGFAKPLIDTGTMLRAVDHEVKTDAGAQP
jgi:hypothetical protein